MKNNVPKTLWSRLQKNEKKIILDDIEYTSDMVLGKERNGIKVSMTTDTRPIKKFLILLKIVITLYAKAHMEMMKICLKL